MDGATPLTILAGVLDVLVWAAMAIVAVGVLTQICRYRSWKIDVVDAVVACVLAGAVIVRVVCWLSA